LTQLDALLALDAVSLAELGLGSVLADHPDLFRHTFRRGELYSAASSSRGVQCQLLATTSASASSSTASQQLHWAYGPSIYRHLRAVRITRLITDRRPHKGSILGVRDALHFASRDFGG